MVGFGKCDIARCTSSVEGVAIKNTLRARQPVGSLWLDLFRLCLFGGCLGLELGQYSADRKTNSGPSREGEGVSLEEDGQQDTENLARRGDRRKNEGIKVGNRVKDKGLPDSGTDGKSSNLAKDLGIGNQIGDTGGHLAEDAGNDNGSDAHEEIRPEHKVVRLGLDANLCGLRLEAFLESRRDAIEGQRHDNVKDPHQTVVTATGGFFLSHGNNGSSTNDGGNLEVFPQAVGGSSQQQGSGHDGGHLTTLGKGCDGETQTVGQGQTSAGLGRNLGSSGDSKHCEWNSFGGSGELHAEESNNNVGKGLHDLKEPGLFEGGSVGGRNISEDIFLEGTIIQKGGINTTSSDQELGAVGKACLFGRRFCSTPHDCCRFL